MTPPAIILVWIFIFVQVEVMIESLTSPKQYMQLEKYAKIIMVLIISIIILIILC